MIYKKNEILIINDNHFIHEGGNYVFKGSKFHLFTKGFINSNITISSPSIDDFSNKKHIHINKVTILPRIGYGQAVNFYKKLMIFLSGNNFYSLSFLS